MADIPLNATGYSCVFNSLVPVVKNNPTVFPDVDKYKVISTYMLGIKKNVTKCVEVSAFCQAHIPHICAYYPEYYKDHKDKKNIEIYQGLSTIQGNCTGHRTKFSSDSLSIIKDITTSEIILAEQYNVIRQIIKDEFDKRWLSKKYQNPKAYIAAPTTQTSAIEISGKVLPDEVSSTDCVIKEQLVNLLKYINSSELLSDEYTPADDNTIASKLSGDIITENDINYTVDTIKSVLNDCICYSDCNGYSVCWCYGNCNYY